MMKTTQRMLLVCAAAVLMGVCVRAQTLRPVPMPAPVQPGSAAVQRTSGTGASAAAPQFKCSGTVKDGDGHLLVGATVEYWSNEGSRGAASPLHSIQQVTTESDGAFEFQVSGAVGILVARKAGLAPAWEQFRVVRDMETHLTLTPPAVLAGVVVDETDKPVANAGVSVAMVAVEISREDGTRTISRLPTQLANDIFAARTDAAGHFRIENLPTNATALLAVQAAGRTLRPSSEGVTPGVNTLPWRAGQEDIKLVVEPAGSVEGKVVVEGGNQPPPIARLTMLNDHPGSVSRGPGGPAQSGADGAFHFSDVAAGSYRIQAVFGTNAVPEWLAAPVSVMVESGQTVGDVRITAA
ncbi:MAG: carboxypeptidase-like regulatory domain-containing protein, partial [Verrucomicrobiota bacterium]